MNQAMRQRALGILVLLALASILLPLLLDFRTGYEVDPSPRIPPAPDIDPKPLPQLDAPAGQPSIGDDESGPRTTDGAAPEPAPPAAVPEPPFDLPEPDAQSPTARIDATPPEPGLDAQGMPRAWVLQLGAFSEEKNALELRDRLLAAGHRAFVQRAKTAPPYRVFVGPKMTKEQLAGEQKELERKFKTKPMVVPFAP